MLLLTVILSLSAWLPPGNQAGVVEGYLFHFFSNTQLLLNDIDKISKFSLSLSNPCKIPLSLDHH
jgi:hypothetical protein